MEKIKRNLKDIRVAFFFKDFAHWVKSSCVGLHVAGFTTAKYLRKHGIETIVQPVRHNIDILNTIDKYNETHNERLTHVIISAPWLSIYDIKSLVENFSDIQFVILSHSNVGFLQADHCGMKLLREYAELSKTHKNFKVGGNCKEFAKWFSITYKTEYLCLPNLYSCPHIHHKRWDNNNPLKIGSFGAIRPEKNYMTAAAASTSIHAILNVPVEFHMLTDGENCNPMTMLSIKQMMENIEGVKLIHHKWDTWDLFIKLIEKMDLLISPSYTESFHMVSADGISVGVPSVVSPVIRWAPEEWKADLDDVIDIAKTGIYLVENDQHDLGVKALQKHNEKSVHNWLEYLTDN